MSCIMTQYVLPKLPYDYHELEQFMDAETLQIHHQKFHQTYVDGLNKSLRNIGGEFHPKYITSILSDLNSIPTSARGNIVFFGGGYENHRLYWETLSPTTHKKPTGKLADSIDLYFGNFETFQEKFTKQSLSIEGSGWCWMVFNPTFQRIEIMITVNNESPWSINKIPLLCIDMWEHAYYLKYQNNKPDYVKAWWNVINWEYVMDRFCELGN